MRRWTLLVLRWRRTVLVACTAGFALALGAAARLPELLTNQIVLPGTESDRAERLLGTVFHQSSVGDFTLVVKADARGSSLVPAVEAAAKRATARLPTGVFVGAIAIDDHLASARIESSLTATDAKRHVDGMRAAIGPMPGGTAYLTGFAAIEHDVDPVLQEDLRKGELLIAIPVAIAMLVWTFGTFSFLVPLILSAFTITITLGIIAAIARMMDVTSYVTNLVGLVGLGIAVDYSLLIVHRYREEKASGLAHEEAIVRTMETAGRAVAVSGIAVATGLALLLLLPLPFLRGFGVGGLLIPAVSVAAALTLLPVLLAVLAPTLERVRCVPARWLARRDDLQSAHGGISRAA